MRVCVCLAVSDAWSESCVVAATSPDMVGYVSNRLRAPAERHHRGVRAQRCGTDARPWIVSVLPGQRINVTLLDFTALHARQPHPNNARKARSPVHCRRKQFISGGAHFPSQFWGVMPPPQLITMGPHKLLRCYFYCYVKNGIFNTNTIYTGTAYR